jgi:MYXO-CTERM domain-containing protein
LRLLVAVAVHTKDDNGCSCRVGGGHDGLAGFALVALGLAFALRARRRR